MMRKDLGLPDPPGFVYTDTDGNVWPKSGEGALMGMLPLLLLGGAVYPMMAYWLSKGKYMNLPIKTVHRLLTLLVDKLVEAEEELTKIRPEASAGKRFEEMCKTLSEENRRFGEQLESKSKESDDRRTTAAAAASANAELGRQLAAFKLENEALQKGKQGPTLRRLTREVDTLRENNKGLAAEIARIGGPEGRDLAASVQELVQRNAHLVNERAHLTDRLVESENKVREMAVHMNANAVKVMQAEEQAEERAEARAARKKARKARVK